MRACEGGTYADTVSRDSCWETLNLPRISPDEALTTADDACIDCGIFSIRHTQRYA